MTFSVDDLAMLIKRRATSRRASDIDFYDFHIREVREKIARRDFQSKHGISYEEFETKHCQVLFAIEHPEVSS